MTLPKGGFKRAKALEKQKNKPGRSVSLKKTGSNPSFKKNKD